MTGVTGHHADTAAAAATATATAAAATAAVTTAGKHIHSNTAALGQKANISFALRQLPRGSSKTTHRFRFIGMLPIKALENQLRERLPTEGFPLRAHAKLLRTNGIEASL